jgi:hypothetical protein
MKTDESIALDGYVELPQERGYEKPFDKNSGRCYVIYA